MNARLVTVGAAGLVVLVGLAIGAWLARVARSPDTTRTVTANTARAPRSAPHAASTAAARPLASGRALSSPTPMPVVMTTTAPLTMATATPVAPASAIAKPAATAAGRQAPAAGIPQGTWEIDEANVQVGMIVWAGNAVMTNAGAIAFDAHKESVAGRPATPCERQTTLHASFSLSALPAAVPYREVNCAGTASTGEVRVATVARDGSTISGTFWQGDTKLGDFTARRR